MLCPECLSPMNITDWKPLPGLDPHLCQFKCTFCGEVLYKLPQGLEASRPHQDELTKLGQQDFLPSPHGPYGNI